MRRITSLTLLTLSMTLGAGCKKEAPPAATAGAATAAAATSAGAAAAPAPKAAATNPHGATAGATTLSGAVVETMSSGGYTYVKLKTPRGEVWAAIRQTPVKVGESVTVGGPMMMKNFKSKTLNRTFAEIYFGNRVGAPAAGAAPGATPQAAVAKAHAAAPAAKKAEVVKVEKAKGGQTVGEVFADRKKLAGKKVTIRGKVTKFNSGIMGKNWLHIQDGTGSAADKSFDLTVTTMGKATVGDIVVVEGTLATDKNFGAGYAYTAIVENATVTK